MVDIKNTIVKHKDLFIMGALLLGATCVAGILPDRVSWFDIEENIKYMYLIFIGIAGYAYHLLYFRKPVTLLNIERSVQPRDLSSPSYQKNLHQQRPIPPQKVNIPISSPVVPQQKPSEDVFHEFNS